MASKMHVVTVCEAWRDSRVLTLSVAEPASTFYMAMSYSHSTNSLFSFPTSLSGSITSTRKTHIHRLNDVLNIFIGRGDLKRARQAWAILARCREYDWSSLWKTGLLLTKASDSQLFERSFGREIGYLKSMIPRSRSSDEVCTLFIKIILIFSPFSDRLSLRS